MWTSRLRILRRILQWTRNMIALRKLFPVFGRGTQRFLDPDNRKVLAYLRQLDGETVLCVANLSRFAQPVALALDEFAGRVPVEMFGYTPFPAIEGQPYNLTLSPYAFLWFQLQKQRVQSEEAPEAGRDAEPVEEEVGSTREPAVAQAATPNAELRTQNGEADLLLHLAPLNTGGIAQIGGVDGTSRAGESGAANHAGLSIDARHHRRQRTSGCYPVGTRPGGEGGSADTFPGPVCAIGQQPAGELASSCTNLCRGGRLAAEHNATAVMLLGQDAGSLNPEAIPALVQAILVGRLRSGGAALPGRTI